MSGIGQYPRARIPVPWWQTLDSDLVSGVVKAHGRKAPEGSILSQRDFKRNFHCGILTAIRPGM